MFEWTCVCILPDQSQFSFQQSLLTWSVSVWLADVRWLSNVSFISFLWFSFSLIRPTRIGGQDSPVQLLQCLVCSVGWIVGSSTFAIKICAFASFKYSEIFLSVRLVINLFEGHFLNRRSTKKTSFYTSAVVLKGQDMKTSRNIGASPSKSTSRFLLKFCRWHTSWF